MNTGPLSLILALAVGVLLAAIWAGFCGWVLWLVISRPELDPTQNSTEES